MAERGGRRIGGITTGGIVVIVGIVGILLLLFWSIWIGRIVILIGLAAVGGARDRSRATKPPSITSDVPVM